MEISNQTWQNIKSQLRYLEKKSPYYQRLFQKNSIVPHELTPGLFSKIPITQKEDLERHNEEFICVPKSEIIDYVTTSGTLGSPVSFALNDHDLERLALNEQLSFSCAGVVQSDIVQITTTLDRRFMAGLAYFLGLRKLGAGLIRTGSGAPGLQWESIERFKPTYLVAVPSFLLKLGKYAHDNGIDPNKSSVKAAICIGEPLRDMDFNLNILGKKIKKNWDIELYSTYASTEMSTAFTECPQHQGGHVLEELIYPEVLANDGTPTKPGEIGELVVTTLNVKTMPLLRYATGDMVKILDEVCACGRTSPRLSSVFGRKKQQIKLKGTTIYPQAVIDVMNGFDQLGNYLIEVGTNDLGGDELEINIPETTTTETLKRLKEELQSKLRVVPKITCLPNEKIMNIKFSEVNRKPLVFRDKRKTLN